MPHVVSRGQQTPGLWHPEVVCQPTWHCIAGLRRAKGRRGMRTARSGQCPYL